MNLFNPFVKKEKYNPETGKFETIQEGLKKEKELSVFKQLEKKYYDEHPEEKPINKLKKGLKKAGKGYMDLSMKFGQFQQQQGNPYFQGFQPPGKKDPDQVPRTKIFDGKRFTADAIRGSKEEARIRAENQKLFWKHTRIVPHGPDWVVYVHGHKRK